ncbi:hypothetical protein [Iningainema tapete]|uniref:Uncharacterized protein n=1 Tax=Iningainema tapete BLCC-T55 TaxID=2748662 RepID=A0A8J6XS15_9CYAN|nr:hypothetical protein [Iningainema tapete]MBD2778527.1 hypothetical protein [Iningainema tapete BLCC-T55]
MGLSLWDGHPARPSDEERKILPLCILKKSVIGYGCIEEIVVIQSKEDNFYAN